jgi:beta-glucanase (GH16 family)
VDAAPPIAGTWNSLYTDNFQNDTTLAPEWHPTMWWSTTSTQGDGAELDTPANVSIVPGTGLVLTAQKDASGNYTSGLVQSGGYQGQSSPSFSFQYGYIEARINLPAGQGLWPAFWLLPEATPAGSTDQDGLGENDIMDNGAGNPLAMHAGVGKSGATAFQAGVDSGTPGPTLTAGWHTIGCDWEPDHITYYVDGKAWATTTNTAQIPMTPEYVILNLSVNDGTTWGAAPSASTNFPAQMDVAYVKVWQKA